MIKKIFRRVLRKIKKRKHPILLLIILSQLVFPQHVSAEAVAAVESDATSAHVATAELTPNADGAHLPQTADRPASRTRWITLTAYSSTPDQTDGDPFTMASGQRVYDGAIAMNGVRFGTKVRFPEIYGNKVFTVLDRMNARYGENIADQWMETREAAIQWGARIVKMEIL